MVQFRAERYGNDKPDEYCALREELSKCVYEYVRQMSKSGCRREKKMQVFATSDRASLEQRTVTICLSALSRSFL